MRAFDGDVDTWLAATCLCVPLVILVVLCVAVLVRMWI
jgi:hypothetical protein